MKFASIYISKMSANSDTVDGVKADLQYINKQKKHKKGATLMTSNNFTWAVPQGGIKDHVIVYGYLLECHRN